MQLKILRTWIATTYFLDFKILLESNHQIHDFLANPREDCTILEEISAQNTAATQRRSYQGIHRKGFRETYYFVKIFTVCAFLSNL
jgi:hypothetical protein